MSEIIMENHCVEAINSFQLPDGYKIKFYQAGDEKHWIDIHLDADKYNEINENVYRQSFGYNEELLKERQFYLFYNDKVIGTSTAWFDNEYKDGNYGRVHWVAIKEEFQGRGLANALMCYSCRTLNELGYDKAYLTTDTRRFYAIKLYEKFGFRIV